MKNPFVAKSLVFIFVLCLASCYGSSHRDDYIDELESKYKELISLLSNPSSEVEMKVHSVSYIDKSGNEVVGYPENETGLTLWSSEVISKTKAIQDHFNKVSMAFLKQDLAGYDQWASRLEDVHKRYRSSVKAYLVQIEKDFKNNPDKYNSFQFGKNLVLSNEKVLFVGFDGRSAYDINSMLDIDLVGWFEDVKNKAIEIQGKSK